jgi:hypothetical protein
MPELQELNDKLKDRRLQILSVNQRESIDQVKYFVNIGNYSFRSVPDEAGAFYWGKIKCVGNSHNGRG